jgi:hypothetical protein
MRQTRGREEMELLDSAECKSCAQWRAEIARREQAGRAARATSYKGNNE